MSNHAKIIKDTSGRRVSRISQACDRCRIKKVKCNGALPSCSNCSKIGYLCKTSDKLTRRSFPKGYTENLEKDIVALQNENLKLMTYIKENTQKNSSRSQNTVSKPFSILSSTTDINKNLQMYRMVDNIALGSEWYTKSLQELLVQSFPSVFNDKTNSNSTKPRRLLSNLSSDFKSLQEVSSSIDSKLEYLFSSNSQSKNNFKIVQILITTYLNSLSSSSPNETQNNDKSDQKSQKNFTINKNNQDIPEVTLPIIINPEKFLPLTANFKQSEQTSSSLSYFDYGENDSLASNHYLMILKKEPLLFKIQILLILYITNVNYSVILNNDVSTTSSSESSFYSTSFFKLNYDFDYLSSIIFDASLPTLKWSNNVSYLQCLLLYLQIALSRSEASSFEFSKESDYSNSKVETLIKCTKIISLIYSIFLQSSLVCPAKLFALSSMKNELNNADKQLAKKKDQKSSKKSTMEAAYVLEQNNNLSKFGLSSDIQIDSLTYIDMLNLYWSYFILCSTFQIRFGSRMSSASSLTPFLHYHYTTNFNFVEPENNEIETTDGDDSMKYFLKNQNDNFIRLINSSHSKIPKDTLLSTPLVRLIDLFDIINLFDILKDRSLSKRNSLKISELRKPSSDHESITESKEILEKEAENLACLSETMNNCWYKKKIENCDDNPAILLLYFQLQILISFRINNSMSILNKSQKVELLPFYKGYLFYLVQIDLLNNKTIHDNDFSPRLLCFPADIPQGIHNINSKARRHSTVEGMSYHSSQSGDVELKAASSKNWDNFKKSHSFYSIRSIENEFILNVLTKNKSKEFKKELSTIFSSQASQIFGDSVSTASILKNISIAQLFKCLNSIIGSSTSPTSSSFKVGFVKLPILAEVPEFTLLAVKALLEEEKLKTDEESIFKDSCRVKDENLLLMITSIMSLFKNYKLHMKTDCKSDNFSATYLMEMFKVIESYFKVAFLEAPNLLNDNNFGNKEQLSVNFDSLIESSSMNKKMNRSKSINELETPVPSKSDNFVEKAFSKQANAYLFDNFSLNHTKDFGETFYDKDTLTIPIDGISKHHTSKSLFNSFSDDFSMKRSASISVPPHSSDIITDQMGSNVSHSNHLFDQLYTFNDMSNNGDDVESDGNGTAAYYMQKKRCSSPTNSGVASKEYSLENIEKITRHQEEKRHSLFSWRKRRMKKDNPISAGKKDNKDGNVNIRDKFDESDTQELDGSPNMKKSKTSSNEFESNSVLGVPHANMVDNLKNLVNFEHVEFADSVRNPDRKLNENSHYEVKSELEYEPHTNYQLSEIKKKFNDFNLILQ